MLTLVEASHFRCLKHCRQPLRDSHLLLGPNASGKSTFLDIIAFLRDVISQKGDLTEAVGKRTNNPMDLLWNREGSTLGFALEAEIPSGVELDYKWKKLRYEITIKLDTTPIISKEILMFIDKENADSSKRPNGIFPRDSIQVKSIHFSGRGCRRIFTKKNQKEIIYYPERGGRASLGFLNITTDDNLSAFATLPRRRVPLMSVPRRENYPAAQWFRKLMQEGILNLALDSEVMRRPSPPGQSDKRLMPKGDNLPRIIETLKKQDRKSFDAWLKHIRLGLPEIKNIKIVERPEDRHRYLVIDYASGVSVPSWLVSDGTLRMLALTLLAYLPPSDSHSIYLLEEPENGIHPKAVDLVMDSLQSVFNGQVLIASHSPVVLNLWKDKKENILCFAKNDRGESDIISGDKHPGLKKYQDSALSLSHLYCNGVLG